MSNNFGLPQRTIGEITDYFASNDKIEKVLIYGSRATGRFHNGSDIDFAIFAADNTNFPAILSALDNLPTPYKFDVTDYNSITNPDLKNSIDKEGIVFYKK